MFGIPDHPVIHNIETTGYPDGIEPEIPICPVCGSQCDIFFRLRRTREIVGCEYCIEEEDSSVNEIP